MNSPEATSPLSVNALLRPSGAGRETVTPRVAAKRAGVSVWKIYRLYNAGFLVGERPTPRGILIYTDSLTAHQAASRDPEFWDSHRLAS